MRHAKPLTIEEKKNFFDVKATLDGKPAKIRVQENGFARVYQIENTCYGAEWSWEAVARVVANGGKFKT